MTAWFRSWHGAPTDAKWLVIARRAGVAPGIVSAVAWALFDYASQQSDRGSIQGFDIETYAVWSGFDEGQIEAVIGAMQDKGVIAWGRLTAWEKRQPKREDDSSQRVAAYRARQHDHDDGNDDNDPPRGVTQCNAPEADVEADTETDSDTEPDTREQQQQTRVRASRSLSLPPIPSVEPSPVEADVVRFIRGIPGLDAVKDGELLGHFREVRAMSRDLSDDDLRLQAMRFRDHWIERRECEKGSGLGPWRGWRNAMTKWFTSARPTITPFERPQRANRDLDGVSPSSVSRGFDAAANYLAGGK